MTRWITLAALCLTVLLLPAPGVEAAPSASMGDPVYCPPDGAVWENLASQCSDDCTHSVNFSPTVPSIDCFGCEYNLSWSFTCGITTYSTTVTDPILLECDQDGVRHQIICPLDNVWYLVIQPQCGSCPL